MPPTPDATSSTPPAVGCVASRSLARQRPVVVVARARRSRKLRGGCAWRVPCRSVCPRGGGGREGGEIGRSVGWWVSGWVDMVVGRSVGGAASEWVIE